MRRAAAAVVWVLVLCGGATGQEAGPTRLVPDPNFVPGAGAEAVVLRDDTPAGAGPGSLMLLSKHRNANDQVGVRELVDSREILLMPQSTRVLVIDVPRRRSPAAPRRPASPLGFANSLQAAASRPPADPSDYPIEARIVDGPSAGRKVYFLPADIGRLTAPAPRAPAGPSRKARPAPRPAPAPRPVSPERKAAASLQLGNNVRYEGNRAGAVGYYRDAVRAAPDSPAGREAAAILKGMGERP